MRKPFTIGDLERRLEAVTLKPRDWVEAVQYVGPDRRRFKFTADNVVMLLKAQAKL